MERELVVEINGRLIRRLIPNKFLRLGFYLILITFILGVLAAIFAVYLKTAIRLTRLIIRALLVAEESDIL
jgi:hypothetical protein